MLENVLKWMTDSDTNLTVVCIHRLSARWKLLVFIYVHLRLSAPAMYTKQQSGWCRYLSSILTHYYYHNSMSKILEPCKEKFFRSKSFRISFRFRLNTNNIYIQFIWRDCHFNKQGKFLSYITFVFHTLKTVYTETAYLWFSNSMINMRHLYNIFPCSRISNGRRVHDFETNTSAHSQTIHLSGAFTNSCIFWIKWNYINIHRWTSKL